MDFCHLDNHLHLPGFSAGLRPLWLLQKVCNFCLYLYRCTTKWKMMCLWMLKYTFPSLWFLSSGMPMAMSTAVQLFCHEDSLWLSAWIWASTWDGCSCGTEGVWQRNLSQLIRDTGKQWASSSMVTHFQWKIFFRLKRMIEIIQADTGL